MAKPNIAILIQPTLRSQLLNEPSLERLRQCGHVYAFPAERRFLAEDPIDFLPEADICLTSWGCPRFDETVLAAAPRLKLIVYCAGSVKPWLTDAVWQRGIRITSGAAAIAVGVAEFVVGQIILSRRRAFALSAAMRGAGADQAGRPVGELWNSTVGLVSLGQVGRRVVEYLKPFGPAAILAHDPHVSADAMTGLGVQKVDLDALLQQSDIVSLHAPDLPETRHLISARELQLMRDDAVLINTARGAVIDEPALVCELQKGRFFACLDVTDPEPPLSNSPLRTLPNVFLTPHIAGPRTLRLGIQAAEEVERFLSGRPQVNEVTKERLPLLA